MMSLSGIRLISSAGTTQSMVIVSGLYNTDRGRVQVGTLNVQEFDVVVGRSEPGDARFLVCCGDLIIAVTFASDLGRLWLEACDRSTWECGKSPLILRTTPLGFAFGVVEAFVSADSEGGPRLVAIGLFGAG